jgi:hypothetical protein
MSTAPTGEKERFMDDQRTPNLEEMDEQQAHRFLTELLARQRAQEDYAMRHQDYTMEIPQSGERIWGREEMRQFQAGEFQAAYPNPPTMQLRRVLVRDGLWVIEWVTTTTAAGGFTTSWPS